MKKNIYSLIIFLTSCNFLVAQDFQFAMRMGEADYDETVNDLAVNSSQSIYSVGYFRNSVDFDGGIGNTSLTSVGGTDIFIQKVNKYGDFEWAKNIGGINNDYPNAIKIDSDDNVYILGHYKDSPDFDPGTGTNVHTSKGLWDVFLLKLNSDGEYQWSMTAGGNSYDYAEAITIDDQNNIYISGLYTDSADLDNNSLTANNIAAGGRDCFLQKISSSGNLDWTKTFGGTGNDGIKALTTDSDGNLYLSGYHTLQFDFDPGTGSSIANSIGMFTICLDKNGDYKWHKDRNGSTANAVMVDQDKNIYETGKYSQTTAFDSAGTSIFLSASGNEDIFIVKMDSNGNALWVEGFGSSYGNEQGTGLFLNGNNELVIGGIFGDVVDFDPSAAGTFELTGIGNFLNCFILTLNTDGGFINAKSFGGPGSHFLYAIVSDGTTDGYCIGGEFQETTDFDPDTNSTYNLTSVGNNDAFLMKLSNECLVNTTVVQNGTELQVSASGAMYQWIDCDNGNATISGATSQTFEPGSDGNYGCIVSNGTCSDTSSCAAFTNTGIKEKPEESWGMIYPNPANDLIYISCSRGVQKVEIFDLVGTKLLETSETRISTNKLSTGSYIVRIVDWQFNTETLRLIKK